MFSIIVPVHNAHCTLNACVESVLAQSNSDFELLLINNGSDDDSWQICQRWSVIDSRIRCWNIGPCKGPAKPRNFGIDQARGDVIVFLDADDKLSAHCLEILEDSFQDADIVFWAIRAEDACGKTLWIHTPQSTASNNWMIAHDLKQQDCLGYVGCKAFRKRAIGEVRFLEDLDLFEDEIFTLNVIKPNSRIKILPEMLYHYVIGDANALTAKLHEDIIGKQELLYLSWRLFLNGKFPEILAAQAQKTVTYIRFYYYEHSLSILDMIAQLKLTTFFQDSLNNRNGFSRKIVGGKCPVYLDYLKWKMKAILSKTIKPFFSK